MKFINIDKSQVPYEFEIALNGATFQFEINYNSVGDFFTVSLKKDHIEVVSGVKVVYGVPIFDNLDHLDIPTVIIKPLDTTGKSERADYDNLNEDVFLYVLDPRN